MYNECIWITGANGRIGSRLKSVLKQDSEYKIIATDTEVDITDMKAVEQAFDWYKPSVVINCASLSDSAYCEENEVEAYKVNTLGARNVAVVSMQHNAKIIHLSTDDVFSGEHNRPKNEFDVPTPSTIYGKSKYAGENLVRELNPKHIIIRSSWVYGSEGVDRVSQILDKAKAGEKIDAAINRISTPTHVSRITDFILKMIDEKEYGIYHLSSEGVCTYYELAQTVLTMAGYDTSLAVPTTDSGEGHVVSTLLDNLMLKMTGIYVMPDWKFDLEEHIKSLK